MTRGIVALFYTQVPMAWAPGTNKARWVTIAAFFVVAGCSPAVKDQLLPFTPDPVAEAKAILSGYASGQPVDSESEAFDTLVQRVAKVDAAKGTELQKFFDDVMTKGVANRAKAKDLLERW